MNWHWDAQHIYPWHVPLGVALLMLTVLFVAIESLRRRH
jgi:hypothetical protein